MSFSPKSQILQRTIDLNYANKKRSSSMKWIVVNGVLLVIFLYDISCKCPGYTSALHYCEAALALLLALSVARHALRLRPPRASPADVTREQLALLGLCNADLDSSFNVIDNIISDKSGVNESLNISDFLSLSVGGSWRSGSPAQTPPSAAAAQHSVSHLTHSPLPRDEFISDKNSLSFYLKQYEERNSPTRVPPPACQLSHTVYQLADINSERSPREELSGAASCDGERRQLPRDARLVHAELNMRRWIHLTILERLVKEMDIIDDTFAKHGFTDLKIGQVSVDRLREASVSAYGGGGSLGSLLPFLQPYPEQRYVVARIRELAKGGCLSAYKWDGGATGEDGWEPNKPTDAEIVMHLFVTYLDSQIPSGGAPRPFSTALAAGAGAGAAAAGGADGVALRRLSARPPHYALSRGADTLEAARGRSNVFLTLVLWAAHVARSPPPALRRLSLCKAGLNMLWVLQV